MILCSSEKLTFALPTGVNLPHGRGQYNGVVVRAKEVDVWRNYRAQFVQSGDGE